jgi:AraC family transcriptional regulator
MSEVRIVAFPATKVMVAEHLGPPELETQTALRLVRWRVANRLSVERHRSYGIHYTDPRVTPPEQHRVDFCLSIDDEPPPNADGLVTREIPASRCAVVRHLGSREKNTTAIWLLTEWLPASGETAGDFPLFFHYVNVGPAIPESELITDVYLPLAPDRAIQNR